MKLRHSAFLLFEVMIAVIVLSAGITMALRSFNSAISAAKSFEGYSQALLLLNQKMFQIKTEGLDNVQRQGNFTDKSAKFSYKIDSSGIEDMPLDKLEVSILWPTKASTRKFSVVTYVARRN